MKEISGKFGSANVIIDDGEEHLQKAWMRGHFYEPDMLLYIWLKHYYPGGFYVDVGSSIGNHTLFFAAFCDPCMVMSIEPVPSSLDLQRRIIELNGLSDRVSFVGAAAGAVSGRGKMESFAPAGHRNCGMMRLADGDEVDIVTLDGLIGGFPRVDLIKIDVEFSEIEVLRGATRTLMKHRPVLFVEIVDENLDEAAELLKQMGYKRGREFNASLTYEFTPADISPILDTTDSIEEISLALPSPPIVEHTQLDLGTDNGILFFPDDDGGWEYRIVPLSGEPTSNQ
jgi:FkbM family methyltransferase